MHNGDFMIKAIFNDNKFVINISIEKFKVLWDEAYGIYGEYDISKISDKLGISHSKIDLDAFVAEQILSILNQEGNEDETANNEVFENCDAKNCSMSLIDNDTVKIVGKLVYFI